MSEIGAFERFRLLILCRTCALRNRHRRPSPRLLRSSTVAHAYQRL